MSLHGIAPPLAWAPLIASYWHLDGDSVVDIHGGVALVFNLGDPVTVDVQGRDSLQVASPFLLGGLSRRVGFRADGDLRLFGVRFRPCGVFPFFSMPQMEFAGQCVVLDELWELKGLGVVEAMARGRGDAPDDYACRFNEFFAARRDSFLSYGRVVAMAVAVIRRECGNVTMAVLAAECGVSRRHLERLFDERIGVTPKHLARMFRLSLALGHLPSSDAADVAARCGYFDQSHLIRECRCLTDYSPSQMHPSS
ncbi:helix-turn-helix transcriptional regulator [Desulfoluna spongiiphila]|uniref:helix-turn-helix transcriptional regulator n=1 Tax=Desulfoluna spongiiphila TaxID=419481 RepID=UPI001257706A|nr:helix-turn-helix transcriptional regulator [Desulfoluna spongiiphila]VVS92503.1 dna binding hth domain arac-type [Desulfoluna spongiiphila]